MNSPHGRPNDPNKPGEPLKWEPVGNWRRTYLTLSGKKIVFAELIHVDLDVTEVRVFDTELPWNQTKAELKLHLNFGGRILRKRMSRGPGNRLMFRWAED